MYSLEEIKNMNEPYELFDGDRENVEVQYVELMKQYHPHLNKQKKEFIDAAKKINLLFKRAEENIENGIWSTSEYVKLKLDSEKTYSMKFIYKDRFELGNMYVGQEYILYLFDRKNEYLAINALKRISELAFKNKGIKEEFTRSLPVVIESFKTANKRIGIVIKKDEELILLKDYLKENNGEMPIYTIGWIIKNIYNLYCFLHFNGVNHNGITIENYYISPKNHWGALLGGWWYAVKEKDYMVGVSNELENIIPNDIMESNKSSLVLDMESIKLLGRTLLGDKIGNKLMMNSQLSKELKVWLRSKSSNNPFLEYITWIKLIRKGN